MRTWVRSLGVIGLAGALAAGGCIAVGGSDRVVRTVPTLGQELRDLQMARDSGAINEQEFQTAKAQLLSPNVPHGH